MAETCNYTWRGLFGWHYCGEAGPHTIHRCANPGCVSTSAQEGQVERDD